LVRLTGEQLSGGALAVDCFFILSGFLITQSYLRSRGLRDYLRRRIRRIYPGFLVAVLFTASVIGPLMAPNRPLYWEYFYINSFIYAALTLDGVVMPRVDSSRPGPAGSAINEINGSLWTIRCEFLCYLGLSLLGLTGALRRRGWVLGLFSVSLAAYCINVQMS